MLKHIVMWKLHESADGHSRAENALRVKAALEALRGRIPGLLRIEVGIDSSGDPQASDLVLYSEFESRAALEIYHHHPLHEAVKPLVAAVRCERRVVDYDAAD